MICVAVVKVGIIGGQVGLDYSIPNAQLQCALGGQEAKDRAVPCCPGRVSHASPCGIGTLCKNLSSRWESVETLHPLLGSF